MHLGLFFLLGGGIDDVFTVDQADNHAGNGAVPRDIGNGNGNGSANHSRGFGRAIRVDRHNGADDGNVVTHIFGEQGANGAVDYARG